MALAVTYCEYNGVYLVNVQIQTVQQTVEYDRSGTDAILTRVELRLRGLIFRGAIKDLRRPHAMSDIGIDLDAITARLTAPRKRLHIYRERDGQRDTIWLVEPASEHVADLTPERDVDRGPRPLAVNVVALTPMGAELEFLISFAIQNRAANEISLRHESQDFALNNRWSVVESFDQNFFCTRMISGTIRLSHATPVAQWAARFLAFPQLEPGFRRDSCEYAVAENGIELSYRIVDRQEHHAPPWPATKMEVQHSETLQRHGYFVQSACQVRLWGPPGVPKALLLARLAQILKNRLMWDGAFGKSAFLESLRIVDTIGQDNMVYGEMIINRFPSVELADNPDNQGDPAAGNGAWAAIGGIAGILGGPMAAADIGKIRDAIKKRAERKANANNPAPAADWFQKLTKNLLGTDLNLPPLPEGGAKLMTTITYGNERAEPWFHIRPYPGGYTTWGTWRTAVEAVFFACYYQVPEHPPHHFHPPGREDPREIDNNKPGDVAAGPDGETRHCAAPEQVDNLPEVPRPDAVTPAHTLALYTFATLQNDYDFDRGRVVFTKSLAGESDPIESDDGESDLEIVTLNRPILYRRVIYEAERIGAWPEIPVPGDYDVGPNGTAKLIRWRCQPQPPTVAADGHHLIYRVRAEYEWAYSRALDTGSFDVGTLPHVRSDLIIPMAPQALFSDALTLSGTDSMASQILSGPRQ